MVVIVMKPNKKISESEACNRAIDRMLKDVTEADRTKLIFALPAAASYGYSFKNKKVYLLVLHKFQFFFGLNMHFINKIFSW